MIKVENGVVEWSGDSNLVLSETFVLLDALIKNSKDYSNHSTEEAREKLIDLYYIWASKQDSDYLTTNKDEAENTL